MKPKLVVSVLVLALAGCMAPERKPAWEAKPLLDIRHGMENGAAFYQLGRFREQQGDLAAAEDNYGKALASDPRSVDALNALGALYARRGETDRAAATFRRVAELTPQRAYLYNNIGYSLYLQGRYGEAIDALRQAVTLDSAYERAWVNLQAAARKAGRPELAALAARRSLEPSAREVAAAAPAGPTPADDRPGAPSGRMGAGADGGRGGAIRLVEGRITPMGGDGAIRLVESSAEELSLKVSESPQLPAPGAGTVPAAPGRPGAGPARIEVSNGNGIPGYAVEVARRLRNNGIDVSRVTNSSSFRVRKTQIQYRPGFADAALALRDGLKSDIALAEARTDRPATDVRLILGKDRL